MHVKSGQTCALFNTSFALIRVAIACNMEIGSRCKLNTPICGTFDITGILCLARAMHLAFQSQYEPAMPSLTKASLVELIDVRRYPRPSSRTSCGTVSHKPFKTYNYLGYRNIYRSAYIEISRRTLCTGSTSDIKSAYSNFSYLAPFSRRPASNILIPLILSAAA